MVTVIIDDDNKEHTVVTQQYEVGLYVIIDSDLSLQFNFKHKENKFHELLRKANKYNIDKSSKL